MSESVLDVVRLRWEFVRTTKLLSRPDKAMALIFGLEAVAGIDTRATLALRRNAAEAGHTLRWPWVISPPRLGKEPETEEEREELRRRAEALFSRTSPVLEELNGEDDA